MEKKKMIMGQYIQEVYEPTTQLTRRSKHRNVDCDLIGLLIFRFNELEASIEGSFSEIISDRSHETGMMIIGSLSYSQKCDIWYKLLLRRMPIFSGGGYVDIKEQKKQEKKKIKLDKFKIKLKEKYCGLKEVGTFRNKVVHGFWHDQDEHAYIRTSNSSFGEEGITIEYVKMTRMDMRKMTLKIEKLIDFIDDFDYQYL